VTGYPTQVTFYKGKQCLKHYSRDRANIVKAITQNYKNRVTFCVPQGFYGRNVQDLTDRNFKSKVSNSTGALITFYAKWCSYCKQFKPELKAAAARLKSSNPDILIASVNAPQNGYTARSARVQSYPTIKWYENGIVRD